MRQLGSRLVVALAIFVALSSVLTAQSGGYTFVTLAGTPGATPLLFTHSLAAAPDGTLVIHDSSHFVLRRVTPAGQHAIVAGQLDKPGVVDGVAAAKLSFGYGVAVAPDGTAYVSHFFENVIRRVTPAGIVTTIAGFNSFTGGAADGTGADARFSGPTDLAADSAGNIFIVDKGNNTIRRMTPAGTVTTVAGTAGVAGTADGVGAAARFSNLSGIAVTPDGSVYVTDNSTVRKITSDGTVTTVATQLGGGALASDANGNLYFAGGCTIRKMTPAGVVTTVAGSRNSCGFADGTGSAARLDNTFGLTVDAAGTVWFVEITGATSPSNPGGGPTLLRSMTPDGTVTTVLGLTGGPGVADGTGPAATFSSPRSVAFFKGLVYETDAMLLRTVTAAGAVKRAAQIVDGTRAVAVDGAGVAYVAAGCGVVKATLDGTVTTMAGTVLSIGPDACGSADGSASVARFNLPGGIAVNAAASTIFVADTGNSTIRLLSASGATTTILGAAGQPGSIDGFGTASRFNGPTGLALDAAGNLFIADTGNHTIRRVDTLGNVTTFAGSAAQAGSADGTGAAARFNAPAGLTLDATGNLYVADSGNATIRRITPSGAVTTIAGIAGKPGVANGLPSSTRLAAPTGVAIDEGGTLYIADSGSHTIRQGLIDVVAPAIMTNPSSASVLGGATVQFTASATGNPTPGFQWEVSANGGATWTSVNDGAPYGGARLPVLTITNTPGSLNGRLYRAVAANPGGSTTTTPASLAVNAIVAAPSALRFAASKTGASGAITASTPPQAIAVTFTAAASTWTAASDQAWLQITGGSGSGAGLFAVALANPNNVIGGNTSMTATITVSAANGLTTTVPVTLTVDVTNASNAPFGSFDTPAPTVPPFGLVYDGSIAVTGWALDDVGVDRIEIWRDPANGETTPVYTGGGPGNGKIFIGNATFVSGARPDVEAAYRTRPNAQRAGWGYLLLTNGLWNQPNFTSYRLYAFAFDVDGTTVTTLGTKQISVNNGAATKPFGAIDTPGQGATVSGTVQNFGWALARGSSCSIANPNVQVSIDSGPLTPVVYGDVRSDIASGFAGFTNSAAAGGHYTLDTTLLTNGVHTIGWLVTDSCGRADGIGSRFFTVANSSSITAPSVGGRSVSSGETPALKSRPTSESVGRDFSRGAHVGRDFSRGADVGRDFSPGGAGGTRTVRVGQNERIEVPLPGDEPYVAGPLPIGSTFDAATNTFMWQPAAGFLGAYDLAFTAGSRVETLRVVVGPPIRMVIDTPQAGNVLSSSGFTVAGWAVDLGSLNGGGIDTLHVWAYPVGGGSPQFVGVAKPGGARPDVARLYGASFDDAGFTLTGTLPPGTYDLVVYAHSAATNTFEGAETLRVIMR